MWTGIITGLLLLLFLAAWAWAWHPRRKREFDEAARLPLEGDAATPAAPVEQTLEKRE